MIDPKRLSHYVMSKEYVKERNSMVDIVRRLTPEQRKEIREMLINNAKKKTVEKYL